MKLDAALRLWRRVSRLASLECGGSTPLCLCGQATMRARRAAAAFGEAGSSPWLRVEREENL